MTIAIEHDDGLTGDHPQHPAKIMGRPGLEAEYQLGLKFLMRMDAVRAQVKILGSMQLNCYDSLSFARLQNYMDSFLKSALAAAAAAAEEILAYYRGEFEVELKADQTPVTVADRRAEEIIRAMLLGSFPDHGFYGEESGKKQADAEYLWLVDPIDGTKSFVGGYSMFSTQIALMHRGRLVLGVSSAPAAGEVAWATAGGGAKLDHQAIRVSTRSTLEEASISTGNLQSMARSDQWSKLGRIFARVDRARGYGDYYHYHRLAAGQLDAVIESDVNILDVAALSVIVAEAGGTFTDLEGRPPGLETTSVLAATPQLHSQLLEILNG
jgi:histidinol-phosphatase